MAVFQGGTTGYANLGAHVAQSWLCGWLVGSQFRVHVQTGRGGLVSSSVNTRSSHRCCLLRGWPASTSLICDKLRLGSTVLQYVTHILVVASMQRKAHCVDQDAATAAGWGHPTACQVDGCMGMHCDFILGARGFEHCIIAGSSGPISGTLRVMIGRELPCMDCRSGAALPTAVRRPGPLKYVTCHVSTACDLL